MNDPLFERLLYEEESATLDFKKEQYRFAKASDEDRSELLKDILGFANAWRRAEAYILVGVEDVRGGRAIVHGIAPGGHLDDHALQQFVNNLTNRPVRFHYEAFGFEEKQVGVIRIEEQARPIYLKRDYGKLQKEKVYIRRGSSTDPTKPATLDEIAQMGQRHEPDIAELVVEFADTARDDSQGTHISWEAECCEMPAQESIPDLERARDVGPFPGGLSVAALMSDPLRSINRAYLRELAEYEFARRLFRPVRLVVRNVGKVAADSVRAELPIPVGAGVLVLYPSELPDPPKRVRDLLMDRALRDIRPALRAPGDLTINKNEERFRIEIECGNLQPGRRVWSEVFWVGKGTSGDLVLAGQVFADNLPQPKDFTLTITANIRRTRMTLPELRALPDPAESD